MLESKDLLQELIDANNRSHDQLVSMVTKLDRKSDEYLNNQTEMKEEVHLLVTNQANIMEDVIEIKDQVKEIEKEKIKDLEKRIDDLEDEKDRNRHFWERTGKIIGGFTIAGGLILLIIKIIQNFPVILTFLGLN